MFSPPAYQPFYCEENIALLAAHPQLAHRDPAALFIRGVGETCVMWHQRLAESPNAPVCWDYHVVLLVQHPWQIWDLDTTLACPLPAIEYLHRSFRPHLDVPPELAPRFRRVPAAELAATFASDRAHMRDEHGDFREPPPPWPAIGGDAPSTLARYLDLGDPIAGEVLDLPALLARLRG